MDISDKPRSILGVTWARKYWKVNNDADWYFSFTIRKTGFITACWRGVFRGRWGSSEAEKSTKTWLFSFCSVETVEDDEAHFTLIQLWFSSRPLWHSTVNQTITHKWTWCCKMALNMLDMWNAVSKRPVSQTHCYIWNIYTLLNSYEALICLSKMFWNHISHIQWHKLV